MKKRPLCTVKVIRRTSEFRAKLMIFGNRLAATGGNWIPIWSAYLCSMSKPAFQPCICKLHTNTLYSVSGKTACRKTLDHSHFGACQWP
jgi:hypothetical protein